MKGKREIRFTQEELYDKLRGGWVGQMAGVAWGDPTEFCYAGRLIPEDEVPLWKPEMINTAFKQDDVYAEIPFLDAMARCGVDCGLAPLAESFRDTRFALWHANGMARRNLRRGIPAPESGAYYNNYHCDDIDWQIESDFLGMLYPGDPESAAKRAFEIGHIMNYGDGVYGGVFVSALHAAAFCADSVEELCLAGIRAVPEGTLFRALLDDVYALYRAGGSWTDNWTMLEEKWKSCKLCPELPGPSDIDAKFNAGYVLIGLLYGQGDFEKTVRIALRCGQDSDCDPSTAGAVLGNYLGEKRIPAPFCEALDRTGRRFSFTEYTFEDAVELNARLMLQQLEKSGAVFENGVWSVRASAHDSFEPAPFEQWPDGVYVYVDTEQKGPTVFFREITPYAKNEEILSCTVDAGDGTVFSGVTPASYTYLKPGRYALTVTVRGKKGSEWVVRKEISVESAPEDPLREEALPVILCCVTSPCGGGNKDLSIIRNGVVPSADQANDQMQYDTYVLGDPHGNPPRQQYVGYYFRQETTIRRIVFTEGNHFSNGGWFAFGAPQVVLLTDAGEKIVNATVDPPYPVSNARQDFAQGYERYVFTLEKEEVCRGFLLRGTGGGSAGFISICELSYE